MQCALNRLGLFCIEWAGYLVPRDLLPPFHKNVARTERCVQRTLPFGPYFLRTKLFVGHAGRGHLPFAGPHEKAHAPCHCCTHDPESDSRRSPQPQDIGLQDLPFDSGRVFVTFALTSYGHTERRASAWAQCTRHRCVHFSSAVALGVRSRTGRLHVRLWHSDESDGSLSPHPHPDPHSKRHPGTHSNSKSRTRTPAAGHGADAQPTQNTQTPSQADCYAPPICVPNLNIPTVVAPPRAAPPPVLKAVYEFLLPEVDATGAVSASLDPYYTAPMAQLRFRYALRYDTAAEWAGALLPPDVAAAAVDGHLHVPMDAETSRCLRGRLVARAHRARAPLARLAARLFDVLRFRSRSPSLAFYGAALLMTSYAGLTGTAAGLGLLLLLWCRTSGARARMVDAPALWVFATQYATVLAMSVTRAGLHVWLHGIAQGRARGSSALGCRCPCEPEGTPRGMKGDFALASADRPGGLPKGLPRDAVKGGGGYPPSPPSKALCQPSPPSRTPSLRPTTVSLTARACFHRICNR